MKPKQTKAQRIVELERQLVETLAGQIHQYHFASSEVEKMSVDHLTASGVVLTLTVLGGKRKVDPVLIRNGLSKETIEALKADFRRSYEYATELKPKGLA